MRPRLSCVLSRARRRSRRAGDCPMTRCNFFSATGAIVLPLSRVYKQSPFACLSSHSPIPRQAAAHSHASRDPSAARTLFASLDSPVLRARLGQTPHTMWTAGSLAADARSRGSHMPLSTCSHRRPTFTTIHRWPDRMFTWQIYAARAVPLRASHTRRRRRRSSGQWRPKRKPRRPMTHPRGPRARRADTQLTCVHCPTTGAFTWGRGQKLNMVSATDGRVVQNPMSGGDGVDWTSDTQTQHGRTETFALDSLVTESPLPRTNRLQQIAPDHFPGQPLSLDNSVPPSSPP